MITAHPGSNPDDYVVGARSVAAVPDDVPLIYARGGAGMSGRYVASRRLGHVLLK